MIFKNDFIGNDYDVDVDNNLNSLGHRCKEISDINLKNYILFAGDNIGLGLGTPIEKTYPYITSKKLNIDYYNTCVFNGGLDAIRYNLISWFSNIQQKPKALIISCEFSNSFITSDNQFTYFKPVDLEDDYVKDFLDAGNLTGYFNMRHKFAEIQLHQVCKVPIYQIIFKNKFPIFSSNVFDIYHEGNMFDHNSISEILYTEIIKITRQMRP